MSKPEAKSAVGEEFIKFVIQSAGCIITVAAEYRRAEKMSEKIAHDLAQETSQEVRVINPWKNGILVYRAAELEAGEKK